MPPEFPAISPNNTLSAIVDSQDGLGGRRVSVFESGAILLYLGEKTSKSRLLLLLQPHPGAGMVDVANGRFWPEAAPGQVHHFIALENEQDRAYGLKRFMAETRRLYGVLDRRVGDPRIRRGHAFGCRLCHPRLGLATPAAQGGARRFPPCPPLVRRVDGAPRRQARHGSEARLIGSTSLASGRGRQATRLVPVVCPLAHRPAAAATARPLGHGASCMTCCTTGSVAATSSLSTSLISSSCTCSSIWAASWCSLSASSIRITARRMISAAAPCNLH